MLLASLYRPQRRTISATVVKVVSTPVASSGTLVDGLDDLGPLGRRLGEHCLAVVSEADDHRQQSAVGRQAVFVKLVDMGIDRLNVLAESLPLGLEATRGVECPDDQRTSLLKTAEDLDGDAVNRPFNATDEFGAIALDRDSLSEHGRRGHDELGCPAHVQS